jgi:DNA-binding NarL/FixJ family response regulator
MRVAARSHRNTVRPNPMFSAVEFVVRGISTARISWTLFISEHTVQNHLRSVFEKVGVRSRGELVKRLFFDKLYPTLFR